MEYLKKDYYFVFSFSNKKISISKDITEDLFQAFIAPLKIKFADFGCAHFHHQCKGGCYSIRAFLCNVDLTLVPLKCRHTGNLIFSSSGGEMYSCSDWTYGFSSGYCYDYTYEIERGKL